ncbi:MAG: hypothetical protein L0212_08740 [Acidobacteria bacterium]|nr:hypothetical protein [Acidobacteriota bacterium]
MRLRLWLMGLIVAALIVLSSVPASARDRNRYFDDDDVIIGDRDDRDDFRFRRSRGSRVIIIRDRDFGHRPHGWNRGRKVGWGNCDLPPGLAKKYGCYSNFRYDNRRVYRRPVIVVPLPFIR